MVSAGAVSRTPSDRNRAGSLASGVAFAPGVLGSVAADLTGG